MEIPTFNLIPFLFNKLWSSYHIMQKQKAKEKKKDKRDKIMSIGLL